jgi:hypothetical protein
MELSDGRGRYSVVIECRWSRSRRNIVRTVFTVQNLLQHKAGRNSEKASGSPLGDGRNPTHWHGF